MMDYHRGKMSVEMSGPLPFALDSLLKVFQQHGHKENVTYIVAHQLFTHLNKNPPESTSDLQSMPLGPG